MNLKKILFVIAALSGLLFAVGCSTYRDRIETEVIPEPELFAMAVEKMESNSYMDAISTFERYMRLYISNPRIQEVRLLLADSYFQQGSNISVITAKSKYSEFLTLYPNYDKADYIWLQIAKCDQARMLPADRDQAATKDAIVDIEEFISNYPDSSYAPEARVMLKEAEEVLAEYHFNIGEHYFKRGIFASSPDRFIAALELNPQFSKRKALLEMLVTALADTANSHANRYEFNIEAKHPMIADEHFTRYEQALYNANKYAALYKEDFAGNSIEIAKMAAEINQIKKTERVEVEEDVEADKNNQ